MTEPSTPSSPWFRQPTDTPASYEAFKIFRDLGPGRTLEKVATTQQKATGGQKRDHSQLSRWKDQHHWAARCAALDDDGEQVWMAKRNAMRPQVAERHAGIAQQFQSKVLQRLQTLQPSELTPETLVRWMEVALKIERGVYGLDDSDQAGTGQVTIVVDGRLVTPPTLTTIDERARPDELQTRRRSGATNGAAT